MLLYDKKILVSGCGITWGAQQRKTWVNVLQSLSLNIVDLAGPAISNQTILNQVIEYLIENHDIDAVIVQLTGCGKLDVEILETREEDLVRNDPVRNFVYKGIWPSSASEHHPAKQMWHQWLYSPGLEARDVFCKLMLLDHWCKSKNIRLIVAEGYEINWTLDQRTYLQHIICNIKNSIYENYVASVHYCKHEHTDNNTVPNIHFQIDLAEYFIKLLDAGPDILEKLSVIRMHYSKK
jgi:hypothetical protein